MLYHSDRSSQYTDGDYRRILQATVLTQPIGRKANYGNNEPMKSFFGTPNTELVPQREYPDRDTHGVICSPILTPITIRGGPTPPSPASPRSRQTQKRWDPVPTLQRDG